MSELPSVLVEDILARLPVKALVRFSFVCKRWRSLFQDAEFIQKQMTFAPTNFLSINIESKVPQCLVFESDRYGEPRLDLEEVDLTGGDVDLFGIYVIGTCNGLFCIRLRDNTLALWNPSLRELRKLPIPRRTSVRRSFGFGYDYSTDDYKIIVLCPVLEAEDDLRAEVYTLKSRYRMIDYSYVTESSHKHYMSSVGVLLGKRIFWRCCRPADRVRCVGLTSKCMLSFDLVSETFNDFSGPPREGYQVLVVVRGSLCVVDQTISDMVVWRAGEAEDTGSVGSWSKLFSLRVADLQAPKHHHVLEPLVRSTAKDAVLLVTSTNKREGSVKLIAIDVEKNVFKHVETLCPVFSNLYEYVKTLVPTRVCTNSGSYGFQRLKLK